MLDIITGKSNWAVQTLYGKPGVMLADEVEDELKSQPTLIMVLEADERQRLAELTIQALSSIACVTEGVQLLPVKNGQLPMPRVKSRHHHTAKKRAYRQKNRGIEEREVLSRRLCKISLN